MSQIKKYYFPIFDGQDDNESIAHQDHEYPKEEAHDVPDVQPNASPDNIAHQSTTVLSAAHMVSKEQMNTYAEQRYQEGYQKARQELDAEVCALNRQQAEYLKSINDRLNNINDEIAQSREKIAQSLVPLFAAVMNKMIGDKLPDSDHYIYEMLDKVVDNCDQNNTLSIVSHSSMHKQIGCSITQRKALDNYSINLNHDDAMPVGDVKILWKSGGMSLSRDGMIKQIEEVLNGVDITDIFHAPKQSD